MKHLVIRNIGPIRSIDIELKQYNFFIGSQSSGKSTIAKILSTCEWIEKEVSVTLNENVVRTAKEFREIVENFHKMNGYFSDDAYVEFETDVIKLVYAKTDFSLSLKKDTIYNRQKICYIPSERNIVTLSEMQNVELKQTNFRSFLFDWFSAREFFNTENKANVLDLGVNYFFDKKQEVYKDRIEDSAGGKYQISLSDASSGLQSVVPLLLMLLYYTDQYYSDYKNKTSFELDERKWSLNVKLITKIIIDRIAPNRKRGEEEDKKILEEYIRELHAGNKYNKVLFDEYKKVAEQLTVPHSTNFIVEEPEQNLFPLTQVRLVEMMFQASRKGNGNHRFTVTTHSPYILNYLNIVLNQKDERRAHANAENMAVYRLFDGRALPLLVKDENERDIVDTYDLTEMMSSIYEEYTTLTV